MERRLAAILAADVVGYSRLMGKAEEATLKRLKFVRQTVTDPTISRYKGRIVKSTGDGLLVEFPSTIEAYRCADAVQREMLNQNAGASPDDALRFRIGIHVGDVIFDESDIFGDGVNIAARLEPIANPGGICISDEVHKQIKKNVEAPFQDAGVHTLKNIAEPMRLWLVDVNDGHLAKSFPAVSEHANVEKPSIAVLPFNNMSSDPEQEYFADGITEDIITELSRIRGLLVIARNSTFSYKGSAIDVKKVAAQLNVKYVLEGSVRRVGNRVRITAQLIEASHGTHVWAERYDREIADLFELQDEITRSIVATLQTEIILLEGSLAERSAFPSIELWAKAKKVWSLFYSLTEESLTLGRQLSREMIDANREHPEGHRLFSLITSHCIFMGFTHEPDALKREATSAIEIAVKLKEDDEHTQWGIGILNSVLGTSYDRAEIAYRRAIEINPNFSLGYGSYGTMLAYAGRPEESIEKTTLALRLNPKDPSVFFRYTAIAISHFLLANYIDAAKWAQASVERKPEWWNAHTILIAANMMLGKDDDARLAAQSFKKLHPTIGLNNLPIEPIRQPKQREYFRDALLRSGIPL